MDKTEKDFTPVDRLAAEEIANYQKRVLDKNERLLDHKNQRSQDKRVGSPDDDIPFAWRHPLNIQGNKKVSKVLKSITIAESERVKNLVPSSGEK